MFFFFVYTHFNFSYKTFIHRATFLHPHSRVFKYKLNSFPRNSLRQMFVSFRKECVWKASVARSFVLYRKREQKRMSKMCSHITPNFRWRPCSVIIILLYWWCSLLVSVLKKLVRKKNLTTSVWFAHAFSIFDLINGKIKYFLFWEKFDVREVVSMYVW